MPVVAGRLVLILRNMVMIGRFCQNCSREFSYFLLSLRLLALPHD